MAVRIEDHTVDDALRAITNGFFISHVEPGTDGQVRWINPAHIVEVAEDV